VQTYTILNDANKMMLTTTVIRQERRVEMGDSAANNSFRFDVDLKVR